MDSARFARIEALFHAALEHPAAEREAFLQASEPDAEVRAEVSRLLGRTVGRDATLLGAIAAAAALPQSSPQTIGPYRVLRELGVGGAGWRGDRASVATPNLEMSRACPCPCLCR